MSENDKPEPAVAEPTFGELIASMARSVQSMLRFVVMLLLIVLVQAGATFLQSRALNDQDKALNRQTENTNYSAALAEQDACVRDVQTAWLHGVGQLILTSRAEPNYEAVRESFRAVDEKLGRINELCPLPKPPGFIQEALGR